MSAVIDKKEEWLSVCESICEQKENEPDWLHKIRQQAVSQFDELGLPHKRIEEWRHTNLSPLWEQEFALPQETSSVSRSDIEPFLVSGMDAYTLVFVDGLYVPALSDCSDLPRGAFVRSIAEMLITQTGWIEPFIEVGDRSGYHSFAALNTAMITDGAYVYIPRRTTLEKPVQIVHYSTANAKPCLNSPRNLIIAKERSSAYVVETYCGAPESVYLTNSVTDVQVSTNAKLEHIKRQYDSTKAFHISNLRGILSNKTQYSHHELIFGAQISRNDIHVSIEGEGTNCVLNGLLMLDGNQHTDNQTLIYHGKPHCESHELYKGILDDKSHSVFRGKIYVEKDAQKTDAKQTTQTLLLSDDAEIDAMPQLEIYADDVKCTHGATTGHLDEEALFYLSTRGVDPKSARALLTYAFACDIMNRITLKEVQNELDTYLHQRLSFDGMTS